MEITVTGQFLAILVSIIGIGVVILIALVAGHIALVRRTGNLPTREEFSSMGQDVAELKQDVAALKVQVAALPTQESINAAITTAITQSEARIIKALVNHRHPEPDGAPVFTEPL